MPGPLDISEAGPLDINFPPDGIPRATPSNNSVGSAQIVDGAIATADIADTAVTEAKLSTAVQAKLDRVGRSQTNPILENDFISSNVFAPFLGIATASGTISSPTAGDANHPGIGRMASAAGANSGYFVGSNTAQIILAGGEKWVAIFSPIAFANNLIRTGFFDNKSSGGTVGDGCWLEVDATGLLTGKTSSNSTGSTTGTSFQLVAGTWYRGTVELNSDATLVTFTLYNDAGTQLWQATLSTNIPTGAGRETGMGIYAFSTATGPTAVVNIDYMSCQYKNRALTRGGVV